MDRQEEILVFIYEEYRNDQDAVAVEDMLERYREREDYDKSKPNFSKALRKLFDKGLLDRPNWGEYTLTDKGEKKADYILNPENYYSEKPEGYTDLVEEIVMFFFGKKQSEVAEAELGGKTLQLSLNELSIWNPDIITEWFEEDLDSFLSALNEATEKAGETENAFPYEIVADLEEYKIPIFKARSGDNYGKPVLVEGIIEGSTSPMQEVVSAVFECTQCGELYEKQQDTSQLKSPYKCDCGSQRFDLEEENVIDVIEFSLTNPKGENENIRARFTPRKLSDEIQKAFRPGSSIRVLAQVRKRAFKKDSKMQKPYLEVISYESQERQLKLQDIEENKKEEVRTKVQRLQENGKEPYYVFARSLAPEIVGRDDVKEIVAASLIGGSALKDDGRIHTYIIGNPGTGKSGIQDYIGETFPNGHYSDASNSTAVGLTATVEEKKGGGYRLVAGKLVYADKGILSIDEFDNIDSMQAKRLNRAMQNGEFSIDKANQHASLPGRATIIATANYKDLLEEGDFVEDFMPDIHESTVDRFSLVYCMPPDGKNDEAISAITSQYKTKENSHQGELNPEEQVVYREMAREKEPTLSEEAASLIENWIKGQETIAESKFKRPDFKGDSKRHLVSLCKLATMFARSNLKDVAEYRDAENAIRLLLKCRNSQGLTDGSTQGQVMLND